MFTGEDLTNLLEDPDRNLLSLCIEKVYYWSTKYSETVPGHCSFFYIRIRLDLGKVSVGKESQNVPQKGKIWKISCLQNVLKLGNH
jgi:hypothetical protein